MDVFEYGRKGLIEEWVHSYLLGEGNNKAFSEGLKLQKRYWLGPVPIALKDIKRTCGPEKEMPFVISKDDFEDNVKKLMNNYRENNFPPLIVEYKNNELLISDGSHRHEAYQRLGLDWCYVIIWNSVSDEYFGQLKNDLYRLASLLFDEFTMEEIEQGKVKKNALIHADKKYVLHMAPDSITSNVDFYHQLFKNGSFQTKEVIEKGVFGDYYELTTFIEGETVEPNEKLIEQGLRVLKEIHTNNHNLEGYGWIEDKKGRFNTYKEFLEKMFSNDLDYYWNGYKELFDEEELAIVEKAVALINKKAEVLCSHHYFVHGDFHFGNIIVNEDIRGVIDWDNAFLGDFVFDIVFYDLGYPSYNLIERAKNIYPVEMLVDYEERVLLNKLILALDNMRFYKKFEYIDDFNKAKQTVLDLTNSITKLYEET